jgi:hypothetical protein
VHRGALAILLTVHRRHRMLVPTVHILPLALVLAV